MSEQKTRMCPTCGKPADEDGGACSAMHQVWTGQWERPLTLSEQAVMHRALRRSVRIVGASDV